VIRRRGRRCRKLLDDLKNRRGYSHLKEEALDCTMWRNRFGGGFEPVVRQYWMNECNLTMKYSELPMSAVRTIETCMLESSYCRCPTRHSVSCFLQWCYICLTKLKAFTDKNTYFSSCQSLSAFMSSWVVIFKIYLQDFCKFCVVLY
jgi:hypothetical protein